MFTKLNPEPTDKWSVLKSDKLNYSVIPIATHFIHRNLSIRDGQLIFNTLPIYGTDRRGSVPPYSICSPILYTRPTHTPPLRSAWFRPGELARL